MKKKTKVFFLGAAILVVSIAMLYTLGRYSDPVEEVEAEFVLCYGEVNSQGHIMSDTAYYFAECVKELSDGKVLIEIYPSGQLGDDAQCYQAMQMGSLDLYRGNSASLTAEDMPMISVMALPYIFDDSEHFWNVCNSELGDRMLLDIQESVKGIRGLAFLDEGARNFMTTEAPITRLEDMDGLRIRMQESDIMRDTAEALGAQTVSFDYVELYSALQGNAVDGAENPLISYYYNKFYEVAPYYVKDEHTYSPSVMMISEITWEALGEEYQKVITEAAKMAQDYNKAEIEAAEEEVMTLIKRKDVVITELEDSEKWREAVRPLYDKFGADFADIINQIQQMR